MSFDVVILQSAETDLKELRSYLTKQFSAQTWQNTYATLKVAVRHMASQPYAGSIPEEIERLSKSCQG
jgi:plasmid stabilization system protein ParE